MIRHPHLFASLIFIFTGQKQRICWEMIGFKFIVGLFSSMQISIKGFLGQRFCFLADYILYSDIWLKYHAKWLFFLVLQILQCLTVQGNASSGGGGLLGGDSGSGVSRAMIKDRFKTFNVQFEDLHIRQSQWTVPDSELRESLRLAVAEVLLPAYRSFIKRFGYVLVYFLLFSSSLSTFFSSLSSSFCFPEFTGQ